MIRRSPKPHLTALLALLVLATSSQLSAQSSSIGGYQLVSEVRQSRTMSLFTYRATLTDGGSSLLGATATVRSLTRRITIVDDSLTFGPVGAGGTVSSSDTFSFVGRRNRSLDPSLLSWTIGEQPNQLPNANAGVDISRPVTETAQLDGSGSSDPEGGPLTYIWTFVSRAPGSSTTLVNPTSVNPTFLVDRPGAYVLQLVVNDGLVDSAPDTMTVTTLNTSPVANAGPDQTLIAGATATLDGGGSTDVDGDLLTHVWSFLSRPPGSQATLSDPSAVRPTFLIDAPGTYEVQLVVNDGMVDGTPDTVLVTTQNSAPVANAGPDQTVFVARTVTLDGRGSTDVDGNPLLFFWTLVSQPAGSTAPLVGTLSVSPTFVPDVPGTYAVQLVVNDGLVDSAADTVSITTQNSPPVANAGPDQSVFVTNTVMLNGSGSTDVDGDLITYTWALVSVPPGSAATLDGPGALTPTFIVDRPGIYVAQLSVNDGTASSTDTVTITTQNSPPVASAGADQTVVAGQPVLLDGSLSSDVDGDPLAFQWSLTSVPAGSAAVLVGPTTAGPTFIADQPGTYIAQLIVFDGSVYSAPGTVAITTTNSAPTANAGADQLAVVVGAAVALDGTQSGDPDGHPLTYSWSLIARPATSAASLSGETTAGPTLTVDVAGDYVAQLRVNDGFVDSPPGTVLIRANSPPVANAGPDQQIPVGSNVQLDGTGSSSPDGAPAFSWTIASAPPGSAATLQNPTTVGPTFLADVAGTYVVDLTVTSSIGATSTDSVAITATPSTLVVTLTAVDADASEIGADPGVFRFLRSGDTSSSLTVEFTIAGTAASGIDYQTLTATMSFQPGEASVDVTITPVDDVMVEGPETVVLALVDGMDYDVGAETTATVTIANHDLPITLALVDSSVVGVGIPTTVRVTLGAPAPSGGVTVDVTSDDTTRLTVAPPGTTTIQAGDTTGDVTLNGLTSGIATVRANAPNYLEGTLDVTVVQNIISTPTTLNVPLGQTTSLPITITRDPGNTGDVVIGVVSANPAAVIVNTPTVTVAAGQLSANATVSGEGAGTAVLTATAANFVSDTTLATTTANLDITAATLTFSSGFGSAITVELESPPGSLVAAPAGGIVVNLVAADSTCVSLQPTVTIAQGTTSTTANVNYGGSAALPCNTTVTASGPVGFTQDAVTVTVNPAPGMSMPSVGAVGGGLQTIALGGTLGASNHGGVTVHVASSDPSRVLLAPNATTAGAAAIDIPVANLTAAFGFVVQGADWDPLTSSAATVTVTASAPGFNNGTTTVSYVQPALRLALLPTSTTALAANADFSVQVGTPVAGNPSPALASTQLRRAGAGDLIVTVTNSDAAVAEIDPNGGGTGVQTLTTTIAAGTATTPTSEFDPLGAGTTVVTATIPGFITTTAGSQTVAVTNLAGMSMPSVGAVGGGLQTGAFGGTLGASNHGGVTVHLASSDPTRVLLAPNTATAGAAALDIPVANLQTSFTFVVQGADWDLLASSAATVTVTASAPGFNNGTTTVSYVQPALRLSSVPTTTTALAANADFSVQVGPPTAGNTGLSTPQNRRFGSSSLTVTVTNSDAAVAEIDPNGGGTGVQTLTTTIAAGSATTPTSEFDPLSAGTTVVTATIPGFITTTTGSQTVTVTNLAGMSIPSVGAVGGGLQTTGFSGTLGAPNHGGVTVHVASSDPSRVLLAPNATTAGAAAIDIPVANLQTGFTFVVQGADWDLLASSAATVTVTASAPGFNNGTTMVSYVQPALRLSSLPTSSTDLSVNTDFGVQVGTPTAGNTGLSTLQIRRFGSSSLTVTVTNSEATVAEIDQNGGLNGAQSQTTTIAAGTAGTPVNTAGGLEFDPLSTGTTVVTATIPGFITTTTGSQTVTVNVPGMSMPTTLTLGGGLQSGVLSGTLGASNHGGITVHLVSSDPTRVLLAPNATTLGAAAIDIPVANLQTSFTFVVQGADWDAGTSTPATVTVTASAPGFTDDTTNVSYVQPALWFSSLPSTTTALAANADFGVQVGTPSAGNTGLTSVQNRRFGASGLTVTVTNSDATVAEIDQNGGLNGAQSQMAIIAAGTLSTPVNAAGGLEFDPLSAGTTVVTASIPGFITTTAGSRAVNVGS